MNEDSTKTSGCEILVALPRPPRELQLDNDGWTRPESLLAFVRDQFRGDQDLPTHAWVRYVLSAGTPLKDFRTTYQGLAALRHAFGRRAFISPLALDHHEIDLADYDHMVNPDSGQYEIEINWRKKRCDGGTHLYFGIESSAEEPKGEHSEGFLALDALESLARVTLGAMSVIQTRATFHMDLVTGSAGIRDEAAIFHVYGAEERPRNDPESLNAAIELAEKSSSAPAAVRGRLSLGLRWANIAFKSNDLLAFWTAIEILANCRSQKVYGVAAEAYGLPRSNAQTFAKTLGLDEISRLRGDLTHEGIPIRMHPQGASYLNALAHDLARHAVGLPPLGLALAIIKHGSIREWFWRDATPSNKRLKTKCDP